VTTDQGRPLAMTRRRLLQGLGALPFAVLTPSQEARMTCPTTTVGSVTAETGSVAGLPGVFEDAFTQKDPPGAAFQYQWQLWVELSSHAGAAERFQRNERKQGELWLLLVLIGGHVIRVTGGPDVGDPTNTDPVSYRAGVYEVGVPFYLSPSPGPSVVYKASVNWVPHTSQCKETGATSAATGTVTFDPITTGPDGEPTGISGSYDLTFGGDHITGSFVAPKVDLTGCPARPSKYTCVA
jgi:hypothetical protein